MQRIVHQPAPHHDLLLHNVDSMTTNGTDIAKHWDVIVVGTGMGGATIGSALAQRGFSVLFLEKGSRVARPATDAEQISPEGRMARGYWPNRISLREANGSYSRFFAAVGCATGGSSIHYAGALERMAKSDFAALRTDRVQAEPWPVDYEDFVPYYEAAEQLFRANEAPLEAILARLSEWDRAFYAHMQRSGLNPEPLHVAIRYDAQCMECIGTICPRDCKSDARSACMDGALRLPNCRILENCDVQTLESDQQHVRGVRAHCAGRDLELTARIVVLAAGALHSPQVLLRSCNAFWPNGLANRSDQVGRNLMFHTSDLFAVWAPSRLDRRGRQKKSLSIRDFYVHEGKRLGYVQSMGLEADRGLIALFLKDQLRRLGLQNELLLALLVKGPAIVADLVYGNAGLFVGSTEDDPNPDNRISLDPSEPDGASFTYTITEDLRQRAQGLYREFSRRVRPWRLVRISPRLQMNYGHPCGTCRFGENPDTSVLDANCRAHDIDNLYVVDSSFMPRSGAVNPSLTIAANALRVATHVAERLEHGHAPR